jgi:uncharacterized protein (UPF0332 family)
MGTSLMQTAWLQLAGLNETAASDALDRMHHRPAISRFYYSAFAAAHAVLISKGVTPPQRGNWGHEGLPEHLETALGSNRDASLYSQRLGELYDLRIEADYGVLRTVGEREAVRSRKLAGPLIRLAEKVVNT